MNVINYAKEHPYATGTIVIVGGILFFVIAFGGSSSETTSEGGPSEAELAADAAIQIANIGASAQIAQANAAVGAAQIGAGVQMNSDKLSAEVALAGLSSAEIMENYRTNAAKESALAAYAAQTTSAQLAADVAKSGNQLAADVEKGRQATEAATLKAVLDTSVARDYINAGVQMSNIDATRDMFKASVTGQTDALRINADRDVSLGGQTMQLEMLQSNNATNAMMHGASTQLHALSITQSNDAEKARDANNLFLSALPQVNKNERDNVLQSYITKQVVPSTSNAGATIGSIAGAISGIFSDSRLKENIVFLYTDKRGRNIYSWNYKGSTTKRKGPMAQEIARNENGDINGSVIRGDPSGFLKVHASEYMALEHMPFARSHV